MKKIGLVLLSLMMVLTVGSVNAKAEEVSDPFENEITINQRFSNQKYDEDGNLEGIISSSITPWQFALTEENPNWVAFTDAELLEKESKWPMKESNYTYWGYSIMYKDGSRAFFRDREFSYSSLRAHEEQVGKKINLIDTRYGDTGSVTFNYNLINEDGSKTLLKSEYSYGLFTAMQPGHLELTGEYANVDSLVNNYIVMNDNLELQVPYEEDQNKVIDIDLRLPVYTINFQDESGSTLKDTVKIPAKLLEAFNYIAPKIDGYKVKVNEVIDSVYEAKDKEFTIIYSKEVEPIKTGTVILTYVDEDGNELAKSNSITGNVGETYSVAAKSITNYELLRVDGAETGKFTESDINVKYIYRKKSTPVNESTVKINYVDNKGNKLMDSETLNGKVGTNYSIDKKDIKGYTFVKTEGDLVGQFLKEEIEVTLIYSKNALPQTHGVVRINYVDQDGKPLAITDMLSGEFGKEYITSPKEFDGYKLKEVKGNEKGVFAKEDIAVLYIYEKAPIIDPTKPEPNKLTEDTNKQTNKKTPNTGVDNSQIISIAILGIAGGIIAIYSLSKKIKKEEE